MPTRTDDALLMVRSGLYVAAVAVPLAVSSALVARRTLGRVCPRWRPPPFVWPGVAVLAFFFAPQLLPFIVQAAEQTGLFASVTVPPGLTDPEAQKLRFQLQVMWTQLVWVPVVLLAAAVVRGIFLGSPVDWLCGLKQLPRTVALGLGCCLTVGTVCFVLNAGLDLLMEATGQPHTEHPLAKLGANGDGVGGVLLVLAACVCAPLMEEFCYRGLLVNWAGGRWYRPWCLLFPAGVLALAGPGGTFNTPAVLFVLVLAGGAYFIQKFVKRPKFPRRTVLAVWSSAALFAAAHSSVWPTPIPLFLLGLGLGYLTARTRSWTAAAVCHACFNAVSTVWVFLRG